MEERTDTCHWQPTQHDSVRSKKSNYALKENTIIISDYVKEESGSQGEILLKSCLEMEIFWIARQICGIFAEALSLKRQQSTAELMLGMTLLPSHIGYMAHMDRNLKNDGATHN